MHRSCRAFFAKEPLIIELFYGNSPIKIRDPMSLRHPVPNVPPLEQEELRKNTIHHTLTHEYTRVHMCVLTSLSEHLPRTHYLCTYVRTHQSQQASVANPTFLFSNVLFIQLKRESNTEKERKRERGQRCWAQRQGESDIVKSTIKRTHQEYRYIYVYVYVYICIWIYM